MTVKEKNITDPIDDTQRILSYANQLCGISFEDWNFLKLAIDDNFHTMHKEARLFVFSEEIFDRNIALFRK